MGTGMCSRRQKGLLHTGLCLLALLGLGSGVFFYNHMLQKAKTSEVLAVKCKQQQEALSAQLQVVYEHRSRLERSLQKERGEHKKTKEDFLVYKLEAQEALNKEKQESMNRYGALSSQHKILKNQHDDMKKQLMDLQMQHNNLKLEHRKTLEGHGQKVSQMQREKENEVIGLKDTVLKLREESKHLRKAYQDIHSQLLSAQAQVEEFRQLKEALRKMPSFKDSGPEKQHFLTSNNQIFKASEAQVPQSLLGNERFAADAQIPRDDALHLKLSSHGQVQPAIQDSTLLRNQSPAEHMNPPRIWTQNDSVSHVVRFARTVNSLQSLKEDEKEALILQVKPPEDRVLESGVTHQKLPALLDKARATVNILTVNEQVPIQSWQDIVNKVNARMTEEEDNKPLSVSDAIAKQEAHHANLPAVNWGKGADQESYQKAGNEEELEMDAGMIDREESLQSEKQHVAQEPLIPDDAADPAKDPNNQGEDEFEEAEINRPDFEEKAQGVKEPIPQKAEKKAEGADAADKSREEPEDHYQDDQEQDIEEHGGELDNADDKEGADIQDVKSRPDEYY
ncbi:RNA polymerase II subunit A C-terminal domain phosphatase SSU72 isoform X1 [Ascaphus truei]|uniref:RNA polymerase II subunit A C-terminal domain phosphatase SSU72 isoform X1 n=2 Tax=Ascaphus truei TaxID=8439 RepID=UPI003F5A32DA